jgi:cobalt-zinc-cadmium efflux system membrane fusion protein
LAEVHCHFDKYDHNLVPGMYMNAEIETSTSFSNAISEESMVNFEGKDFVFVEEKKQTYKLTPVTWEILKTVLFRFSILMILRIKR